jgi:5S rRNA maturation endonuclease (ribonuclease M5)
LELKEGRKSAAELEAYMKSGTYERMGKAYMVKRNIEYFAKSLK